MRFGSRMVGVLSGHGLDHEEEGRSGHLEGNLDRSITLALQYLKMG